MWNSEHVDRLARGAEGSAAFIQGGSDSGDRGVVGLVHRELRGLAVVGSGPGPLEVSASLVQFDAGIPTRDELMNEPVTEAMLFWLVARHLTVKVPSLLWIIVVPTAPCGSGSVWAGWAIPRHRTGFAVTRCRGW